MNRREKKKKKKNRNAERKCRERRQNCVTVSTNADELRAVNGETRVLRSRYNERRTKITFVGGEPIYIDAEGMFGW